MSPKLVYVQCAKECVFSPVSWATLWPNLLPHLVINTRDTKRSMRRVRERVEKSSLKIPEKSSSSCSCEWVCREAAHFSRLIYHSQRWGSDRRPCCVCCISKHTLVSHLPQITFVLVLPKWEKYGKRLRSGAVFSGNMMQQVLFMSVMSSQIHCKK